MINLRQTAKECPHCMGCGLQNPNGDLLCLAHSNQIKHGKGRGLKSLDIHGAILCHNCHDRVDGRTGKMNREQMQTKHSEAASMTRAWWYRRGFITKEQYFDL